MFEHLHTATFISVPRVNAAPSGYAISADARAALAKTFRLEYDLYHFLRQRLLGQVTEVCTPLGYFTATAIQSVARF